MTRQTMIDQIVTARVAGMVMRKELPETNDELFKEAKDACSGLMENAPTDEEINNAFKSGMPLEYSEVLVGIYKFINEKKDVL